MTQSAPSPEIDKKAVYRELARQIDSVIGDLDDEIATMASTACLIHRALPYASWTGFYRVVEDGLLRIGPYQGPLGCLEIRFGAGVCGAVAAERRSKIVDDVHSFAGHIACDEAARSEVVVPIFRNDGRLAAVLDLDSHEPAAFDRDDADGLEAIAEILRPRL